MGGEVQGSRTVGAHTKIAASSLGKAWRWREGGKFWFCLQHFAAREKVGWPVSLEECCQVVVAHEWSFLDGSSERSLWMIMDGDDVCSSLKMQLDVSMIKTFLSENLRDILFTLRK